MARIFLSHASADNASALALGQWLQARGWSDFFLDIDADRGIVPGERWMSALAGAVERCEAVVFLVSPAWQASKYCFAEFYQARNLGKRLFGVIVEPVDLAALPEQLTAEWQVCDLSAPTDAVTFSVEQLPRVPLTQVAFSAVALDALALGLTRAGLAPSTFEWPPESEPRRSPYPGLRALDEADAAVFFGRDAAIVRAMDQLRLVRDRGIERLFVVLGASGAGKSSFLRAGLLPRLRRDSDRFVVLPVLRPERAAMSGTHGLLAGLQQALAAAGQTMSLHQLRDALAAGGLAAVLHGLDPVRPSQPRRTVVVAIDQAEELLTADGQAESDALLQLLAGAAATTARDGPPVLFLMTIRSDSLPRLQAQTGLQALAPVFFSLPAMPVSEFKAVIEGPAQRHSASVRPLSISAELAEELVADAQGPDALPLLALTLEWLYREYTTAEGTRIGHDEYHRLGGVRGVISQAVQRALDRPGQDPPIPTDPAQQERLLMQLFPFIATVDPDTGERKRRVALRQAIRDAAPQADALVSRLVAQRLLLADVRPLSGETQGAAPAEVVEVTHEALLRQWSLLEAWLRDLAVDLSNTETLRRAAHDWQRGARDDALLVHTKGRLEAAESLLADARLTGRFEPLDHAYVAACRARDRRELQEREAQLQHIAEQQAARARLQRRATVGLAAAAVVVAGFVSGLVLQTQGVSRQTSLVLAGAAETALDQQASATGLRLALLASEHSWLHPAHAVALPVLSRAVQTHTLRRRFDHRDRGMMPVFSPDGSRVLVAEGDQVLIRDVETGASLGAPLPQAERPAEAVFSPDGARVLIVNAELSGRDWQAKLWDARSGRLLAASPRLPGRFWRLFLNHHGDRLLTVLDADQAQLWDLATWQPVGARITHGNEILGAVFSPDDQRFVTYGKDNQAVIRSADTGEPVGAPMVHDTIPQSAQYSADGRRILTTAVSAVALQWDAGTGQPLAPAIEAPVRINAAQFSPDGRSAFVAADNKTVALYDTATGQFANLSLAHTTHPVQMAFSADGRRLVTLSGEGGVQVWDAATGVPLGAPLRDGAQVADLRFSADGTRVLGRSRTAAFAWDARAGAPVGTPLKLPSAESRAFFLADSRRVLVHALNARLNIVDPVSAQTVTPSALAGVDTGVAHVSPDGRWIVDMKMAWDMQKPLETAPSTLRVIDTRSATVRPLGGAQTGFLQIRFNATGTRVLVSSSGGVTVWDLATAQQVGAGLPAAGQGQVVDFAPDGQRLLAMSAATAPRFTDHATGTEWGPPLEPGERASALLSANGDRALTLSDGGAVQLWDATKGRLLRPLRDKRSTPAPAPGFSRDGRFILIRNAAPGVPVRIADATTGSVVADLLPREPVKEALFSRDSRLVITLAGKAVEVWDVATGRRVGPPLLHQTAAVQADSSADGQWLLTVDGDRVMRLWPLPAYDESRRRALQHRACETLDPGARTLSAEDLRAAPVIEPSRAGEALCSRSGL